MPSALSGHDAGGGVSKESHIAFVPLPFVGQPHGDASLLGVALVLPRGIAPDVRTHLMRLVADLEKERGVEIEEGTL